MLADGIYGLEVFPYGNFGWVLEMVDDVAGQDELCLLCAKVEGG
jgi:hypothetical protein